MDQRQHSRDERRTGGKAGPLPSLFQAGIRHSQPRQRPAKPGFTYSIRPRPATPARKRPKHRTRTLLSSAAAALTAAGVATVLQALYASGYAPRQVPPLPGVAPAQLNYRRRAAVSSTRWSAAPPAACSPESSSRTGASASPPGRSRRTPRRASSPRVRGLRPGTFPFRPGAGLTRLWKRRVLGWGEPLGVFRIRCRAPGGWHRSQPHCPKKQCGCCPARLRGRR